MALRPEDYTVGWICALAQELAAARRVLDEEYAKLPLSSADSNSYHFGRIGPHNVVITVLPLGQLGNNMAGSVATSLRTHFPALRFGLFTGIGGGVPSDENDVRLGDVVVSAPSGTFGGVVQYDLGKKGPGNVFERTGQLNSPPEALLTALSSYKSELLMAIDDNELGYAKLLEAKFKPLQKKGFFRDASFKDVLYLADGDEKVKAREERENSVPVIFFGTVASGNQVMKSAEKRDRQSAELGGVLCFEMEAAGIMNTFPCLVFRGISDYCDSRKNDKWQNFAAAAAAVVAADFLKSIPVQDVQRSKRLEDMISGQTMIIQDIARNQAVSAQSMRAFDRAYLYYLKPLPGVVFDEHNPSRRPSCQENTRLDLLREIDEWQSTSSKPMYWLSGHAGSGKSTIARTVTSRLKAKKTLAGSYFVSKTNKESCAATSVFRTIAWQLATAFPELGVFISGVVSGATANRPPVAQLEEIILAPLRKYDETSRHSPLDLIAVIDALDDCDDSEGIVALLSQSHTIPASRIRFFVTSNSDGPVSKGIQSIKPDSYQKSVLHEIPQDVQDADIHAFLLHELVSARAKQSVDSSWPSEQELASLVGLVAGSFTYATIACRFIGAAQADPRRRLAQILSTSEQSSGVSHLDSLYKAILTVPPSEEGEARKTVLERRRAFFGIMAVSNEVIAPLTCAGLVGVNMDEFEALLQPLGAVVDLPSDKTKGFELKPLSLSSFILDGARCPAEIFMGPERSNAVVADRCFVFLNGEPGFAALSKANPTGGEIPDRLLQQYRDCRSHALGYAYRNWLTHLRAAGPKYWPSLGVRDGAKVHVFFSNHMTMHKFRTNNRKETQYGTGGVKRLVDDIWKLCVSIQNEAGCAELRRRLQLHIGIKA